MSATSSQSLPLRIRSPFVAVVARHLAVPLMVCALALTVGAATVFDGTRLVVWLSAVLLWIVGLLALRGRSAVGPILVLGVLSFGMLATFFYHPVPAAFSGWRAQVTNATAGIARYELLPPFIIASGALLLAFLIFSRRRQGSSGPSTAIPRLEIPTSALLAVVAVLALYIFGLGPSTIMRAREYLAYSGPDAAVKLGGALGPVAVVICGYFTFNQQKSTGIRLAAVALAFAFEAIYLGTATRRFALWFVLMGAGGLLAGKWDDRQRRIALFVSVGLALVAIQIPLGLRSLQSHGLTASVNYLVTAPSSVFGETDPFNNVLFGSPLTHYVAYSAPKIKPHETRTSLSPIPSRFNDWHEIQPNMRVNEFTPYNGIGELLNRGWTSLLLGMFFIGTLFALAERIVTPSDIPIRQLAYLMVLGLAGYFVFVSTQYNLRSVARLPYYAITVAAAGYLASLLIPRFSGNAQDKQPSRLV